MSYLLDKQQKRKKISYFALGAFLLLLIFYFYIPIFSTLSGISYFIFRPVLILKNNVEGFFSDLSASFRFKNNLLKENEILQNKVKEAEANTLNYNLIIDENFKLKEILDRKNIKADLMLGAILSKPNQSPYDTLIIDIGTLSGVLVGSRVFAYGNIPIGRVDTVYSNTSKVVLYSNNQEKTEVSLEGKDVFLQIVGRGGGNFEMILPRDFSITEGASVFLPGVYSYVIAKVETIISDPRDSFTKAILSSPVNINELRFVQVQK